VRYAHGFGTGSCGFSGFQPCKTANSRVAFPKTEVLGKPLLREYFRNRLGLANGSFVTRQDLEHYGRTDVIFYKFDIIDDLSKEGRRKNMRAKPGSALGLFNNPVGCRGKSSKDFYPQAFPPKKTS
jgi:hypothetical protein